MNATATAPSLKVLRRLGADAQTEAYLAEVDGFPTPMLVRLVNPELAQDAVRIDRLLADAQRLTTLAAPGLLQVRSAGRMSDGRVYVLSDFTDGQPPAADTCLPLETVVEVGEKLSQALAVLHEAGLVLGTLTSAQLLLGAGGARLDPAVTALTRPASATAGGDVRALGVLLRQLLGVGAENKPFESALVKAIDAAGSAPALVTAFQTVRLRWANDTSVSAKVLSAVVVEPDLTGQRLGPYQLTQVLGEGAMGRVYLGKHHRIGREAAVKVLKAEHAQEKDLVQRFIQEATAVAAIKNDHIVEVHDFGDDIANDGTAHVYCVMEVLRGRHLAAEIARGPMEVRRACKIIQQVTQALGAAHALGVVHRDVKPENIFLQEREGDRDYVKVLDFGVAKLLKPMGEMPTSSTQAGTIIGTPDYMAPEQAMGLNTDLRSDLYSVGLVLYELLSGKQPFHGATFGQLVVAITTTPPPPLPAREAGGQLMPPRLVEIVNKCLAKKPEARFATAAELHAALEPFAHTGNTLSFPAVAAPRSRRPIVAIAAAVALLGGTGLFFALRAPPPAVEPLPAPAPDPVVAPVAVVEPPAPTPAPVVEPPAPVVEPVPVVKPPVAVKPLDRLTGKDVAKVFVKSQGKLRSCLSDHRKLLPSKEGELLVNFTVLDTGAVSQAKLGTPGFDGVVGDCVIKRLKDLRFPRHSEKSVTFELPLAYVFKD